MLIIQIVIILFALFAVSRVFRQFRQRYVSTREFLFWLGFWFIVPAVAVYPELASRFAHALGVGRGADAIVYSALLIVFYVLFRVFARLQRIEQDVTKIVREIALRDAEKNEHAPR